MRDVRMIIFFSVLDILKENFHILIIMLFLEGFSIHEVSEELRVFNIENILIILIKVRISHILTIQR